MADDMELQEFAVPVPPVLTALEPGQLQLMGTESSDEDYDEDDDTKDPQQASAGPLPLRPATVDVSMDQLEELKARSIPARPSSGRRTVIAMGTQPAVAGPSIVSRPASAAPPLPAAPRPKRSMADVLGPSSTSIQAKAGTKRRKKSRKKRSRLSPELERLMGEANMAFMERKLQRARELLLKIIKIAPNAPEPYQTLGLVYEESNDTKRAVECYIIAQHFTKKDPDRWRALSDMALRSGHTNLGIYALGKVSE